MMIAIDYKKVMKGNTQWTFFSIFLMLKSNKYWMYRIILQSISPYDPL